MARSRVGIHIVREKPEASGLDDRLFVILLQILRTERTDAVLPDFMNDVFVCTVWPESVF